MSLGRKATEWSIEPLGRLLRRELIPNVRLVKDIQGSSSEYILLSSFDPTSKQGLIAVFDRRGTLKHFRFIKDRVFHQSLVDAPEPLWWSRRWLPSLSSPDFPLRKEVDRAEVVYRRLIDGYAIRAENE